VRPKRLCFLQPAAHKSILYLTDGCTVDLPRGAWVIARSTMSQTNTMHWALSPPAVAMRFSWIGSNGRTPRCLSFKIRDGIVSKILKQFKIEIWFRDFFIKNAQSFYFSEVFESQLWHKWKSFRLNMCAHFNKNHFYEKCIFVQSRRHSRSFAFSRDTPKIFEWNIRSQWGFFPSKTPARINFNVLSQKLNARRRQADARQCLIFVVDKAGERPELL
jgi:hypothetical protein